MTDHPFPMDDTEDTTTPEKPKAPSGQHIFDNDRLEQVAKDWKKMVAEGRRNEAMPLLEELIKGCQDMLPRLAQYEGFHLTVDVDTLIAGASAKIEAWLMAWKPDYKNAATQKAAAHGLFSFLSKCTSGDTRITYANGERHRIDEIVENKLTPEILAYDEVLDKIVTARVVDWHKNPAVMEEWRKLQVKWTTRRGKTLYVTGEHPMYTQRGWVAVDDLVASDTLHMGTSQFTPAGWSAIVGMYLGDGHLRPDGCLVVGHGDKQHAYVEHLAEKFNQVQFESTVVHNFGGSTRDNTRVYDVSKVTISLKERSSIWHNLVENVGDMSMEAMKKVNWKKCVTPWVISQLNPVALAYWYMDDGSTHHSPENSDKPVTEVTLHTENFSIGEVKMLQDYLLTLGVNTAFRRRKLSDYGYLYITAASRDTFFTLVAPHVIPSMRYKLPEEYRDRLYEDLDFVETKVVPCSSWKIRVCKGHANNHRVNRTDGPPERLRRDKDGHTWFTPDWKWKYNIEVDGPNTYIAEGIVVHNCAKNAFRSELSKVNQYRRHFHASGENLEKFYGEVDYQKYKDEATQEVRNNLKDLTVRWGAEQEIGCVRFIVESITEEKPPGVDEEESATETRERITRSAAYAWCVSPDMAKFFYSWAVYALRDSMYKRAYIPFTEEDVLRHAETYTHLPDLMDIIGWDKFKRVIATLGGTRLKLPTMQQLGKLHENYRLAHAIQEEGDDPETVERVGKRFNRSQKTAQQVYVEVSEMIDHRRCGEHSLFSDDDSSE